MDCNDKIQITGVCFTLIGGVLPSVLDLGKNHKYYRGSQLFILLVFAIGFIMTLISTINQVEKSNKQASEAQSDRLRDSTNFAQLFSKSKSNLDTASKTLQRTDSALKVSLVSLEISDTSLGKIKLLLRNNQDLLKRSTDIINSQSLMLKNAKLEKKIEEQADSSILDLNLKRLLDLDIVADVIPASRNSLGTTADTMRHLERYKDFIFQSKNILNSQIDNKALNTNPRFGRLWRWYLKMLEKTERKVYSRELPDPVAYGLEIQHLSKRFAVINNEVQDYPEGPISLHLTPEEERDLQIKNKY
ncbi:MAG: hypothetical protein JWQ27_2686 [Ferruginibacter sp.]|nr:hypothetical protein [Ferruginibacter sp.]